MSGNRRRPSRRSFLARVLGAGTAFGATALVAGAHARQVRSWSAAEASCASGLTDNDSGEDADPAGNGRGANGGSGGITDSDSGAEADPAGQGRGGRRVTDTDIGWGADRVGQGRGGEGRERPAPPVTCPPGETGDGQ